MELLEREGEAERMFDRGHGGEQTDQSRNPELNTGRTIDRLVSQAKLEQLGEALATRRKLQHIKSLCVIVCITSRYAESPAVNYDAYTYFPSSPMLQILYRSLAVI